MNILYVTPYVPSQVRTRPYNLIRALVRLGHQITLLAAAAPSAEEQEQADELREWGVHAEIFPVPLTHSLRNCLRALPSPEPLQAVYAYHPAMERRLRELLQEKTFDVVHIEHLRAARLVQAILGVPTVYDSVDCISSLFEQTMKINPQWRARLMAAVDLKRTRRYEAWLLTRYDQSVITSHRDKEALETLARRYLSAGTPFAPVTVVTNGVDLGYFTPRIDPPTNGQTIVFTGKMSYHANVAAALYFAQEVLPRIWESEPEVQFQIVGKDPPETIRQLASDARIGVTGYVADIRPYLSRAAVAVCPALYAVGIQNKVLEAMAMGTPVVCTSAAFDGIDARDEESVLVADDPGVFATQVLRILSNGVLGNRLSKAGRQFVETHHSWEASARQLVSVYQEAALEKL